MPDSTPLDFLRAVYPEPFPALVPGGDARLVIWTLRRQPGQRRGVSRSYWTESIEEAAAIAAEVREAENVFYGAALHGLGAALAQARQRRPGAPLSSVRGGNDSAIALGALWVDLDVAGPGHSSATLPPDRDAALGLLNAVPAEPSCLVHTGGGFHVYWLLREPWLLDSPAERAAAGSLVRRVQWAVRREAAGHGWSVDATADLARVLRLPGTLNHKTPTPRPAEVERLWPERRYDPHDFDLLADPPGTDRGAREGGADPPPDFGPPAKFEPIWAGCSWIRFCHRFQEKLSEKAWFLLLTIVPRTAAATRDGDEIAHQMSCRYPRYSREETDDYLRRVMAGYGPCTCSTIAEEAEGAWENHCSRCPHWGKIKGPIVLGRPSGQRLVQLGPPATPPRPPSSNGDGSSNGRVRIHLSHLENEVADQALCALAEREENLFRRGGALVQVVRETATSSGRNGDTAKSASPPRPAEPPAARQVQEARMRELLATHCEFLAGRRTKAGLDWRPAHPPQWTSRALLGRFDWPELPCLAGLAEGPVLRPDGSVLQTPGYDPASGLFLAPAGDFEPVPEEPTAGDVEAALLRLQEAVCDFPFAGPEHLSAWLAALLTPLARFAFRGPSPVNLIDANVRGAGKSLLADVCHLIVTGRPAARMPYTRDESELRKEITSIALKARQLVVIDNVSGGFGSPTLDLAFTATSWADRLLGQNVDLELPLSVTWYVTGNNIELRGDMPRRCLHIRLESPEEKPEHRAGFRHPRLVEWLEAERARLLPAALTLLAAYRAAGRPPQELRPWGSFEGWSDLVRATLVWMDLPDPALTCDQLESTADAATAAQERLLQGLDELLADLGGPATVHQVLAALADPENGARFAILRAALVEVFPRLKAGEVPTPVQLGRKLSSLRGRLLGGRRVSPVEKTRSGAAWAVQAADDA